MSTHTHPDVEQRVESLLAQLRLEEKAALLSGRDTWHTAPVERLGIPALAMTDGPHGVRATDVGTGRPEGPATAFPTGVSIASTWNPELIERAGAALGEETRGMGCDILLGPCVNIVRHPLAGRNFESYSEDPYLAGRIGVAFVKGVQSRGVGTSLKHYACNNQEIERWRGNSVVDERALREIYLAQFEAVVTEAGPWTVMCSYNRVNGVYASQHDVLLNRILKGEWGYDGVVISDWGANHTTVESVQGGLDIEMPGPAKYYGKLLVEAVDTWQIDEARIDEAARRILRMIVRSGRLDDSALPSGAANTPEHQQLAREVAEEAITLLKNERGALPLKVKALKSVAVVGPAAADMQVSGGGSSRVQPPHVAQPLDALKAQLEGHAAIHYAQGCDDSGDASQLAEAVELARRCNAAVVFAGMSQDFETEGRDRPDMGLPGAQDALIEAVARANPNTIVVLNAGAPVAMPWIDEVAAVVVMHYPGQEGGRAIANVLTGQVNPSGKLSVTWPRRLEDTPAYANYPGAKDVWYGESLFVGYRDYDLRGIEPLFPFGHGLSYTSFAYGDLRVPKSVRLGEPVTVSVVVTNTGSFEGKEVTQLYVSDRHSSLARPPKELKGFAKVALKPGESKTVSFTLDRRALSFYDPSHGSWVAEPGEFEILVGGSSRDIRARATFEVR